MADETAVVRKRYSDPKAAALEAKLEPLRTKYVGHDFTVVHGQAGWHLAKAGEDGEKATCQKVEQCGELILAFLRVAIAPERQAPDGSPAPVVDACVTVKVGDLEQWARSPQQVPAPLGAVVDAKK